MSRRARLALSSTGLVIVAITLGACGMSVGSGVIGSLGAAIFAAGLLFGAGSQSGCDDMVGPCLSPIPEDAAEVDSFGPCLGMALPDAGTDATDSDALGVCLTPVEFVVEPDLPEVDTPSPRATPPTRSESLDRLKDRLPADVVDRLTRTEP